MLVQSGTLGGLRVHLGSHCFARAPSRGHRVYSDSRVFTLVREWVTWFILVYAGHSGTRKFRQVDSGSRRFTRARLRVAGFIRVGMGSIERALGS